jgi:phage baseplate assembly protein gpV
MGEEGLRWFVATVEDVDDPLKLGRVKIRVVGEHEDPKITKEHLLWATPITSINSASYKNVGISPTGMTVGAHVFGFYLDGHEKQLPVIWGSYAKLPDGTQKTNDVPPLAREINNIDIKKIGPEPDQAYAAKYPHNIVFQSRSGHVIELDDTAEAERIRVYHKTGTYVEINKDGRKVTKVVDDDFDIVVKDKTVYIGGNVSIHVVGSATIKVDGDVTANVAGDFNATIDGDATLSANSWDITGNISLHGSLTADNDVIADGISLDNHTHPDPQGGNTGKPN